MRIQSSKSCAKRRVVEKIKTSPSAPFSFVPSNIVQSTITASLHEHLVQCREVSKVVEEFTCLMKFCDGFLNTERMEWVRVGKDREKKKKEKEKGDSRTMSRCSAMRTKREEERECNGD
jgi:hypothetical protein